MNLRNQALRVEITDARVIVSIGFDALIAGVEEADFWDAELLEVSDANAFASAIAHALEDDEDENGLTPLQAALDRAAQVAVEEGCDGVTDRSRFQGDELQGDGA